MRGAGEKATLAPDLGSTLDSDFFPTCGLTSPHLKLTTKESQNKSRCEVSLVISGSMGRWGSDPTAALGGGRAGWGRSHR